MTALRFLGDWSVWTGTAAALGLAAVSVLLYRRQLRGRVGPSIRVLPWLRAAAVFLVVMMLTGPVLHHRRTVGELLQLKIVIDASQSMARSDRSMETGRKLRIAQRLGWLGADAFNASVAGAADELARAAELAARLDGSGAAADPGTVLKDFAAAAANAAAQLDAAGPGVLRGLVRKGSITREVWNNIPGKVVDNLTRNTAFAGKPNVTDELKVFASPNRNEDNFGVRLRGYVHPPATGDYTFWIYGDDQCELWLSPDFDPAKKERIARVPDFTPVDQWDLSSEQKSRPVRLEAGRRYYVEVLQKEELSEDHVAVGWQLPGGALERPIPGSRLSPVAGEGGSVSASGAAAELRRVLAEPARVLAGAGASGDRAQTVARIAELGAAAAEWEGNLRTAFEHLAQEAVAGGDPALRAAVERFDRTPRWSRAQSLLLEGPEPVLRELSARHDVELSILRDGRLEPVWSSRAGRQDGSAEMPDHFSAKATGRFTDLSGALESGSRETAAGSPAADAAPTARSAVLLVGDGAHNEGDAPLHRAKVLGARGIPVFTLGFGTPQPATDLAVAGIDMPRTLFHKDRLNGTVVLKDDMPAGKTFTLKITAGTEVLWTKELSTTGERVRSVPFDFPVENLVSNLATRAGRGVERSGFAIDLAAELSTPEGDQELQNNRREAQVFATLRRNRALILEGRPRWEWRYLRNLLDRDEQWQVNSVLAFERDPERGDQKGRFPATREALFAYDLIVIGEFPPARLKPNEWEWIRDFTGDRGGGLIFIDGPRGVLRGLAGGPLAPLLPVEWTSTNAPSFPRALQLTAAGRAISAFDLGAADTAGAPRWTALPPPHWLAPVRALPGAETLVEAISGEARSPAVVLRRFGGGRALYFATDETWRWRREVADRDHQRFWNQIALWMMEAPFTVSDGRVAVDAGAISYRPGESASIRVRLRDEHGNAVARARAFAAIFRNGTRVATLPLEADERGGGVFRAATAPLEEGKYEVRVRVDGIPDDDVRAQAEFAVAPGPTAELTDLGAREDILRELSRSSGGLFAREENRDAVLAGLQPLSHGKVVESDTVLWQGYGWFGVVILLLTAEWILRKRRGLL